jgi:hypothetical protein
MAGAQQSGSNRGPSTSFGLRLSLVGMTGVGLSVGVAGGDAGAT